MFVFNMLMCLIPVFMLNKKCKVTDDANEAKI